MLKFTRRSNSKWKRVKIAKQWEVDNSIIGSIIVNRVKKLKEEEISTRQFLIETIARRWKREIKAEDYFPYLVYLDRFSINTLYQFFYLSILFSSIINRIFRLLIQVCKIRRKFGGGQRSDFGGRRERVGGVDFVFGFVILFLFDYYVFSYYYV